MKDAFRLKIEDGKYYTLSGGITNGDWVEVVFGGGGSSSVDGEIFGDSQKLLRANSIHGSKFIDSSSSNQIGSVLKIVAGSFPTKLDYHYSVSSGEPYIYVYRIGNNDILKFDRGNNNTSTHFTLPNGFAAANPATGIAYCIDSADIAYNKDANTIYIISNCQDSSLTTSFYQSIAVFSVDGALLKIIPTASFTPSINDFCCFSYDTIQQRMYFFSNRNNGKFYYVDSTLTIHAVTLPTTDLTFNGIVLNGSLWVLTNNNIYQLDTTTFSVIATIPLIGIVAGLPTSRLIAVGDYIYGCIGNNVFRYNTLTNTTFASAITSLGVAKTFDLTYVSNQDSVWISGSDTQINYVSSAASGSPSFSTGTTVPSGFHAGIKYLPVSRVIFSTAIIPNQSPSSQLLQGESLIQSNQFGYVFDAVYTIANSIKWMPVLYKETTYTVSGQRYMSVDEELVNVTPNVSNFAVYLPYSADPLLKIGKLITIKDVSGTAGTNTIRVNGQIDGVSFMMLTSNYVAAQFVWNGTEWNMINSTQIVGSSTTYSDSGNVPLLNAINTQTAITNLNKNNFTPIIINLASNLSNYNLSSTEYSNGIICLTGLSNASFDIFFPLFAGRRWSIQNKMTGAGIMNATDGFVGVHIPKYTKTDIEISADGSIIEYAASSGGALEYAIPASVVGAASGTFDTAIITLPAFFRLTRAEIRVKDSLAGGSVDVLLGTSVGGNEILLSTNLLNPTDIAGADPTQLGADMNSTYGYESYYTTAKTVNFRFMTTTAISSGSVIIYLAGFRN